MGKGRFTALDVTAMTTSLREILIGTRIANIYDLTNRTYLIKFSGKDKRLFLVMESGIRFHCTRFMRELPSMPNHFCSKLRKYLRSKKISFIRQIGRDRIVIFEFGAETHKLYLMLELYGGGNIILCDYEWKIILCLRVHGDIKHGAKYPSIERKSQKTDNQTDIEQQLRKCIGTLLKNQSDRKHNAQNKPLSNRQKRKKRMNQKMETIHDFISKTMSASPLIIQSIMHKFKINKTESLLHCVLRPHPIITSTKPAANDGDSGSESESEDEIYEDPMYANQTQQEKLQTMQLNQEKVAILMQCFTEYERLLSSLKSDVVKGFIISKRISLIPAKKISVFVKKPRRKQVFATIDLEEDEDDNDNRDKKQKQIENMDKKEDENIQFIYDEFIPFEVNSIVSDTKNTKIESWKTFNECVDEFYSSNEAVKSDVKQTRKEMLALKKLETAKGQHQQRIHKLQSEADNKAFYASIIEENLELVDKAMNGVNALLSQGIDWNELGNRIREETQFGNPIASIITSLKLHEGIITLKLKHETIIYPASDAEEDKAIDSDSNESDLSDMFGDDEADEDNESNTTQKKMEAEEPMYTIEIEHYRIDVELRLSAWNNARRYYAMKKHLMDKKDKTLEATNKAIAAAQKKTKASLAEAKQTLQIEKLRKTYWFEKFYWFISSDNLLVIAGRDAQQNEIIVKKYTDKQRDIYVHALIHGASSVIIKNPNGLKEIPPRTLSEAGAMCVCRSKSWNNNVATESYWVRAHQVSKTPQSGQYLPTGSFVIRGKRNFITQQALAMAIVLLFRIDERSYELNHKHERCMNYFNKNKDEDKDMQLQKNKQIGDVTQQFILNDINEDNEEVEKEKVLKKKSKRKNEENAIYVTRTMIHSDPRQRKLFEEQQRQKNVNAKRDKEGINKNENQEESEIIKKEKGKKKNKTDKKLAKYGFSNVKDKKLSKREKNKRKKRGKYNKKYDEADQKLIQELLGIKPQIVKEEEVNEKKENKEEMKENEPKEGYALNANPVNLKKNIEVKEDNQEQEQEEEEEDQYDKQRKFALTNRLEDDLKLLTGKVYENDTVLYCMTMCVPYSCVANKGEYEYRIKIQPGTTKRGKAVKYVNELFQNMCRASPLNAKLNLLSLCKAIKDTEINHIFLSNVKLSSPGMKSLKIQHKQNQKKMQKEKWKEKQKTMEKLQKQSKQYNPSTNPKKRKKRK